ncbi:MAG: hypothetical protein MUO76_11210 [Anaerolineaceae bacterium]|nr:hypothetical protein [Anaerolineaceae bacterium]
MKADEVAVMDAGVKLSDLHEAKLDRYVLRLATNFTARHNQVKPYSGKGRKQVYGRKVSPLARTHKGKRIAATSPDRVETWSNMGLPCERRSGRTWCCPM